MHAPPPLPCANLSCCPLRLSLSRVYEEHILASGSLDERIFTNEETATPGACLCEGLESHNSAPSRLHSSLAVRRFRKPPPLVSSWFGWRARMNPTPLCSRQASALKVSTPLTGRSYVQDYVAASPISTAMNSVGRLHTLLSGTQQGPSAKLAETLRCVLKVEPCWGPLVEMLLKVQLPHQDLTGSTQSVCQRPQ